eukprot:m.77794 g.77794  ORF g.77794 m.77794 type:complete len:427 (+) comp12642_c0_seq1:133-1413(+)
MFKTDSVTKARKSLVMLFHYLLLLQALCFASVENGVFVVTDYGGKGDGVFDNSRAIAATFSACQRMVSENPTMNPIVIFPAPGVYITGPWNISCNNSKIVVEKNATIKSVNSTNEWPLGLTCPEPSQGKTNNQAAPFMLGLYSYNVTITGGGTIDALGDMWWKDHCGNWWCPNGSKTPVAFRPFLLRLEHANNISIENINFLNPGFWCLVPVHSHNIMIKNTTIVAPSSSPNTDGIEPMWSSSVHVQDVDISNGDDCITIKSGSRNVLVERVTCHNSHGLTIGSIWYDDVDNVTYRDAVLHNTGAGPRIKGRSQGNATVSNIVFENIVLDSVDTAMEINMLYETPGSVDKNIGVVAVNISYINVTGSCNTPASLQCLSTRPCLKSISMDDVHLKCKESSWKCSDVNLTSIKDVNPSPGSSCHPSYK